MLPAVGEVLCAVLVCAVLKYLLSSDVEKKLEHLIGTKQEKEAEVASLLETVDSLRQEISKRAEGYIRCTS